MTSMLNPTLSRRSFIVSSATAAGGLMLGFHLPHAADATEIAARPWLPPLEGGAEINALTITGTVCGIEVRRRAQSDSPAAAREEAALLEKLCVRPLFREGEFTVWEAKQVLCLVVDEIRRFLLTQRHL